MNAELQALLADLARYLDQQRQLGHEAFLETGIAADGAPAAAVRPPSPPEPAPDPAPAPSPDPSAPHPAPPPLPAGAVPDPDDPFAAECARFVRASLERIAAARRPPTARPSPSQPAQESMFQPTDPRPDVPDRERDGAAPEAPADRTAALARLADEVRACTRCGLHQGRQHAVPGAGDPAASLVLVGEAPGAEEDRQGLPFVGASGQLLTRILAAIGFSRDDVFICNILKCRPPGNRDPQADEVAACQGYLRRQLAIIRPRVILCLGRVAAQTLLQTGEPLGRLRQEVRFYAGVPVMATYHPAALLRNPANRRPTWDDVRKLRALHDALAPAP